jgi:hypothetical protein
LPYQNKLAILGLGSSPFGTVNLDFQANLSFFATL